MKKKVGKKNYSLVWQTSPTEMTMQIVQIEEQNFSNSWKMILRDTDWKKILQGTDWKKILQGFEWKMILQGTDQDSTLKGRRLR